MIDVELIRARICICLDSRENVPKLSREEFITYYQAKCPRLAIDDDGSYEFGGHTYSVVECRHCMESDICLGWKFASEEPG